MEKEEEKLSEIVPEVEDNTKLEKRRHRKVIFTLITINIVLFIYIIYQIIFLFINLNK